MKLLSLLVVVSCLVSAVVGYGSGISNTVFSLANFQTDNGGFNTQVMEGEPGTLDDTAHALFLASLFGVKHKIDVAATNAFLQTLQNSDGGYSNQAGGSSDLESVRNALTASLQLGSLPPDTSGLISFVSSLYDSNTKLYRNAAGRTADLRATARALQIFQLLDFTDKAVTKQEEILKELETTVKTEEGRNFFSTITSDNYYGILVAHLAGYEFEEPQDWSAYFLSRQVDTGAQKGGFYSDDYATEVLVSDAAHAAHALWILNDETTLGRGDINLQALNGYLNSLSPGLSTAGHAYSALARTSLFQDGFKITPTYVVSDPRYKVVGTRIIQGTLFRPNLSLRTTYGQVHSGATAAATIRHGGKSENKEYTFNTDTQTYETTGFYDTNNLFGDVSLSYSMKWTVPGYGELSFTSNERKSIGYDLSVVVKALYNDDDKDPEQTIGVGTSFTFDVRLGTVAVPKPQLLSGAFEVVFTVLDSSNVAIHTDSLDGSKNSAPIAFTYDLASPNLPSGRVTFRFQIKNEDGVHTTEEVWYILRVQMAATEIDFERDQELNFGQTFTVTMEPATLVDNTPEKYDRFGSRKYFLDVYSSGKVLLGSFPGTSVTTADNAKYSFEYEIPARFDFVGTHTLKFRYTDAFGNDFELDNYNSEDGSLYTEALTYNVDASLEIAEFTGTAPGGVLEYGDEVSFSFKVKDIWSDTYVNRGANDATVFLALKHTIDGKTFSSSKVRTAVDRDPTNPQQALFTVSWEVDPNALKEAGKLVLYASDADGNEVPLKQDGEQWSVPVTIGGSLSIDEKAFSSEYDDYDTSFVVYFDLSSKNKKLVGSELTSKVTHNGKVIAILPAAASPEGGYSVSWTLDSDRATSGSYLVDIYRRVDLDRATTPNPYESAKPFFTVDLSHEGRASSPLPFRTEFLALLGFFVVVIVLSVQKQNLEKRN